jgi:PHS family inorganic phosphate transporter-like MFS transporter
MAWHVNELRLCNVSQLPSLVYRYIAKLIVWPRQGFGNFAAAIVSFVCIVVFKDSLLHAESPAQCNARCQLATDKMWRIIIVYSSTINLDLDDNRI